MDGDRRVLWILMAQLVLHGAQIAPFVSKGLAATNHFLENLFTAGFLQRINLHSNALFFCADSDVTGLHRTARICTIDSLYSQIQSNYDFDLNDQFFQPL